MADIRKLHSDDELGDEACAWLARLNAPDVSAQDKANFDAWRAADPRHARALSEALLIWRRMTEVGELARAVSEGHKLNSLTGLAIVNSVRSRGRRWRTGVAAAASVAVAVCVALWMYAHRPDQVFQTAVGEHSVVKLPDGSSLELNSDSRLRVAYGADRRLVKLERGEAYFDVQKDPKRPFWVAAGGSWVGAVGTAFSVDIRSAGIRVTVSEGAVKVASGAADAAPPTSDQAPAGVRLVRAGQQINVRGGSTEVRSLVGAQLARTLAWREGQIYFRNDRLADVLEELQRYSGLTIVLEGEGARQFKIAGTFDTNADGVDALLVSLENGFGLHVRREGRTVYVSQR